MTITIHKEGGKSYERIPTDGPSCDGCAFAGDLQCGALRDCIGDAPDKTKPDVRDYFIFKEKA